jgi:hypothetical protein
MDKDELGRKRFFDQMKQYQDKNELKAKQFADFMFGKDLASLSK